MTRYLKTVVFTFCLLGPSLLFAQHPAWRRYGTADGLPSNAVYGMLLDRHGMMWFTTDLGICHFNGYEFHRPVDTSVYASTEAYKLVADNQGRIWFNRLDASVWLVENDTVRPWEFNHVIRKYKGKFVNIGNMAVDEAGTAWIQLPGYGLLVVKTDGEHEVLLPPHPENFIFTEVAGQVIFSNALRETPAPFRKTTAAGYVRWDNRKTELLGPFKPDYGLLGNQHSYNIWRLRNGDIIINRTKSFYVVRNNRLIWSGNFDVVANDLYEDRDGALMISSIGGKNRGLLRFKSTADFMRGIYATILPDHGVVRSLRDHEGGWWAVTIDAGIFYCKNPDLEIFDTESGLPSNDIHSITTDGRETIFAYSPLRDVCAINIRQSVIQPMPIPPGWLVSNPSVLRFDTLAGRLWLNAPLSYHAHGHWNSLKYHDPKLRSRQIALKKITSVRSGRQWWAGCFANFYSIDPVAGTYQSWVDSSGYWRTHAAAQDFDGNIWVATDGAGLRRWRNGHFEAPTFFHPGLRYPIRLVEVLPDSSLILSLRGGGLLIRSRSGICTQLTVADGLSTNWLSELDIAPDGTVYAASNAGLNVIRRDVNGAWRVNVVNSKHGLPSDQVNDVAWLGPELWIATDQGIARFRQKPAPAPMSTPWLERFTVNSQVELFWDSRHFSHRQNNISFRFFALHYRSTGYINYRYRLMGADTAFVYTTIREVNFASLAPGKYVFEVNAQDPEGQWSRPARWAFEIEPPWWATWWFRLVCVLTLGIAGFRFYRRRLNVIKEEAAEREKMRELEAAALRAQMNPHFIFNCLQAIQSFIAQNEREVAIGYMARFARLVRLTLHGSVDGHHSLAEEISMLENYLILEQMRFNGKFEFEIRTAPDIDPEAVRLPPLLVQPFVENALLHGLKDREGGGRVEVHFSRKQQMLEVLVTDNGRGFAEKEPVKARKPYNSVGMMLTQKRLDLLAGATEIQREDVVDAAGLATGTRIRLEVPLEEGE